MANHVFSATGVENTGLANGCQSSRSFAPVSYDSNLDGFFYDLTNDDDEYTDIYADDLMDVDEYAMLQTHFDKVDIPPGVEAPLPWLSTVSSSLHSSSQPSPNTVGSSHGIDPALSLLLPEPFQMKRNRVAAGGLTSKIQMYSSSHHPPPLASSRLLSSEAGQSKEKVAASCASANATVKIQKNSVNAIPGVKPSNYWGFLEPPDIKKSYAPSSSNYHVHNFKKKCEAMKLLSGAEPLWGSIPYGTNKLIGTSSSTNPSIQSEMGGVNIPSGLQTSMSWWPQPPGFDYHPSGSVYYPPYEEETCPLALDPQSISIKGNDLSVDEVLKKFKLFKQFETVDDYSDHYYARNGVHSNQVTIFFY